MGKETEYNSSIVSLQRIFSRKSVACGVTPFLPKHPLPPPNKQTAPARGEAPIGLSQKEIRWKRTTPPNVAIAHPHWGRAPSSSAAAKNHQIPPTLTLRQDNASMPLVAVAAVPLTAFAMEDHHDEGGVYPPTTIPPSKSSGGVRKI